MLTKLLLLEGISRETVVSARYLLAVILLVPFGLPEMGRPKTTGPPRRRDWVALFLVGALGSGVGALLFTAALEYSSAGIVNSISKTAPIFVAFFGYLTLRERVSSTRLLLVGAMVGADVLIGLGELGFAASETKTRLIGDGLALLAGLTRATAEILAKGALARFSPSTVSLWRFGAGFLVTGTVAFATGTYADILKIDARGLAILGLLAGVSTALSMYLYYRGTAEIPVHVAVSLKILGAVVTAIVSWIVLQETLNLYHVAGMGLLISGAYLLVMRTARETAVAETLEQILPRRDREGAGRLRVRLTLVIAGFTLITVLLTTVISVRHTNNMVRQQIRLTMGKVAAVLVQLTGVDNPPPRHTLQQYLDRVVRHRIQDEAYSVDIVYIIVADEHDTVLAFAVNEQMALVDETGRPYRAGDMIAARRLMSMSSSGALPRTYDLIPVRAELQQPDKQAGTASIVEIGCKRSIANRVLAEIAVRNGVLALILLAFFISLAVTWVRRFTNPLERIAVAMQRLSGGDLDLPLYTEGRGEVRQMGESLQVMRDGLRMGGALRRALVRYATSQIGRDLTATLPAEDVEIRETAFMFVGVPPEVLTNGPRNGDALVSVVDAVVSTVLHNEGNIDGYLDGRIVASWDRGGEEDALWAILTALELRGELEERFLAGKPVRLPIIVETAEARVGPFGTDAKGLREAMAQVVCEGDELAEGVHVLAGRGVMLQIGQHLQTQVVREGRCWRIIGLAEEEPGLADLVEVGDD